MKTFSAVAALAAASSVFAAPSPTVDLVERASSSLTPITVKGNAFFQGEDRFYIRGIDYQPGGSSDLADPIAEDDICMRDIAEFKKLGINTVRIYSVDNTANHDKCMKALEEAGIYLVLDVNTPKYSLNRANPHASYNQVYLQNIFATIDAFAAYPNTLAFFSGNEVINDAKTVVAAPYVKAVTRDMRQYIGSRGYRQIPVGYSAADVDTNRLEMAEYMNCGPPDERSDFFAFNDYSWCDPSSFQISGWEQKVKNFTGYGIPIFLSEYGCNTNERKFQEVKALYSEEMSAVYSGGLVYEYTESGSKYGLVKVDSNTAVTELPDFKALQIAFKNQISPSGSGGYNSTGGESGCPAKSANWDIGGDDLPQIPTAAAAMMKNGAGEGAGLSGSGSHFSKGTSPGTAEPGSGTVTEVTPASTTAGSDDKKSAGAVLGPIDQSMILGLAVTAFAFFGGALL